MIVFDLILKCENVSNNINNSNIITNVFETLKKFIEIWLKKLNSYIFIVGRLNWSKISKKN